MPDANTAKPGNSATAGPRTRRPKAEGQQSKQPKQPNQKPKQQREPAAGGGNPASSRGKDRQQRPSANNRKSKGKGTSGAPGPARSQRWRDPQAAYNSHVARCFVTGRQYQLPGLPYEPTPIVTFVNRIGYSGLLPGSTAGLPIFSDAARTQPAQLALLNGSLPRYEVPYLVAAGRASAVISVSLASGPTTLLIYATPDQTSAFAAYLAPPSKTSGTTWPDPRDTVPRFGNYFEGFKPTAPTYYASTVSTPTQLGTRLAYDPAFDCPDLAGGTTRVYPYDEGASPYTAVSPVLFDGKVLSTGLFRLGGAEMHVELVSRDPEITMVVEHIPGGTTVGYVDPDGAGRSKKIAKAAASETWLYPGSSLSVYQDTYVCYPEQPKLFGTSPQIARKATVRTHLGEWQPISASALEMRNFEAAMLTALTNSTTSTGPGYKFDTGSTLPNPYASRGLWVAVHLSGPVNKVTNLTVKYRDWWGVLPNQTRSGFNTPNAVLASIFRLPMWLDRVSSVGASGPRSMQAVTGVLASHALVNEPDSAPATQKARDAASKVVKSDRTDANATTDHHMTSEVVDAAGVAAGAFAAPRLFGWASEAAATTWEATSSLFPMLEAAAPLLAIGL